MVTTAIKPARTTAASTELLARAAIAELVAFWAGLPVDPIDAAAARAELLAAVPGLRRLAEAVGA
jgi:hypothetical protein